MNEEQKKLRREFSKKQWEERRKNHKSYLEVCKNMSDADKGHKPTKPFEKGHLPWNKGKNLTEEHKINIGLSRQGKGLGNTNGFKKGQKFWLGKKRPYMKNIPGWNRIGLTAWNKGKQCSQLAKENHWNWQDGKSCERHSFYFKSISKLIRINAICSICGTEVDLVVHHKDLNKKNDILDNFEILCRSHHTKLHHDLKLI